jgi:thymidylate synthase (FAD)
MNVKLIHVTPDAETLIAYCARVSSEKQENPEYAKLLAYCIKHKHWSIFQMASLCVEITTSRAIAAQILRHRSMNFQEFSQRYQAVDSFEKYEARRQDKKNKQNSIDDMSDEDRIFFDEAQDNVWSKSKELYDEALARGIAKEQARFLLPLNTTTKLYMHGTVRDMIHYCTVRCDISTQKEHRAIALDIWAIIRKELPVVAQAVEDVYPAMKGADV